MPVSKIDPKVIFASEAPAQDAPAVFTNKTVGWGESRKNGGRPTIKQSNALQQETDLKILWLNENSVTPYDATIDYPVNAVTIKDGVFKIFNGTVWNLFLDKTSVGLGNVDNISDSSKPISTATQTALNLKANQTSVDTELAKKADKLVTYTKVDVDGLLELKADLNIVKRGIGNIYSPTLTYSINERAILTNGDVVKSIVNGNTNNPNTNMVGWSLDSLTPSKNLSDLPNVSVARDNLGVYSEAEVDAIFAGATTTPNATETTAGKAKIATTAIAQAGVNDTDFITALKLANTRQSVWVNKTGMLFGTTYMNTALCEKEISFISAMVSGLVLTAKVTFKNLTTNIETIVYFGCVSNWTGGIASSANFVVPPNTSFKIEIVRTDNLSTVVTSAVNQWSERYYV